MGSFYKWILILHNCSKHLLYFWVNTHLQHAGAKNFLKIITDLSNVYIYFNTSPVLHWQAELTQLKHCEYPMQEFCTSVK